MEPKFKAFCVSSPYDKKQQQSRHLPTPGDSKAAHAQVATDKLWPSGQDVLFVYFITPNDLDSLDIDKNYIIELANKWQSPTNRDFVPRFKETQREDQAKIRVAVGKTQNKNYDFIVQVYMDVSM